MDAEKEPSLSGGDEDHGNHNDNDQDDDDDDDTELSLSYLDVSVHPLCWALSCPCLHCGTCPFRTVLHLDRTGVTRRDFSLCGQREVYVPYTKIQAIDQSHCCCCFTVLDVQEGIGTIFPGMGCDPYNNSNSINNSGGGKCQQIARVLKHKIQQHTTIHQEAQQQRLQAMEQHTISLTEKLDLVLQYLPSSENGKKHSNITMPLGIQGMAPLKNTMADRSFE